MQKINFTRPEQLHDDAMDEKNIGLPDVMGPPDVHEEISALRDALNQTRTELSLHRRRMDRRQVEVDAHIRRTNRLWSILFVVGISAVLLYCFRNREALFARVPAVQKLFNGSQGRLSSPAVKTAGSEQSPNTSEMQAQRAQLAQTIDSSQNIRTVQSQLGPVASTQEEKKEGPGGLKGDVTGLRKDVTIMKQDYGEQTDHLQRETTGASGAVSSLDRRQSSNSAGAQLLADGVNRNRIDFEVSRNRTEEVAPGIFLTVRDMNVDRQQTNGWLQIAEDGRTVWFRDQGAQKVMTFVTKRDDRRRELVFTRVHKDGASGYLLIPASNG